MMNYKTVAEKASEWNISTRHLQYLCKKGSIESAVKKAGIWFIPDDVPIPVQYSKSGGKQFNFIGTKKKIFDCAIELFKIKGFDAVSIKDVADAVGITQSSMYNHFKSKQEILDTMYDYYCYYFHKDLPTLETIDTVLQNGSLVDILKSTTFQYHKDYARQMSGIVSIIFYRCAIDDRAKEIKQSLMIDKGVEFVESVFDRAMKTGRLAPMDKHAMAVFINSIKIYSLHIWIADPSPETSAKMREDEINLYRHAARLLTDLKFPNEN